MPWPKLKPKIIPKSPDPTVFAVVEGKSLRERKAGHLLSWFTATIRSPSVLSPSLQGITVLPH